MTTTAVTSPSLTITQPATRSLPVPTNNIRNITKEIISHLDPAPLPPPTDLLQVRHGKVQTLVYQPSAIFKRVVPGRSFVTPTGLATDEHVYHLHGGHDRALNQYCATHYADWRREDSCPHPELFEYGGFGENLVVEGMDEENVCVGDVYRIGDGEEAVLVQVSEPRSPCNKLNLRFEWPRALKRVQRTGRVGWNYRVVQTGWIEAGMRIELVERPNPRWSLLNVKRVIQGKKVVLGLVVELTELEVMTAMLRELAQKRLETTMKKYRLVKCEYVTSRVKHLTFQLDEGVKIRRSRFQDFSFAQIEFGKGSKHCKRSYSIVSEDKNRFSLGIALDDHSRGGSAYMHQDLLLNDTLMMAPGISPKSIEDEEKCIKEDLVDRRIIVIGGIGVTAFLPIIKEWDVKRFPYEIHYATTFYAKSHSERLNVSAIIPEATHGQHRAKIYACGPGGLMKACDARAKELHYPEHMLHFENFGVDAGGPRGDPFEVEVNDTESGKKTYLKVPADKTLLTVLREAGLDMTYFCEMGGCGACKVTLCNGKVKHNGEVLPKSEEDVAMLSCVERAMSGEARIKIELD